MPNSQQDQQQRIAPSTVYEVPGSPDQYRFVLRGADLVLIDENNQEQVFMFVGNIMSLDGSVNMNFADGQSLNSQDLFTRSEMEDMEQFDNESTEWEVESRFSNPVEPEDQEGNTEDGKGLLPPAEQNDEVPAQAEGSAPRSPTDDLFEMQRRLIAELSEKGDEEDSQGTDIDISGSGKPQGGNETPPDPDPDPDKDKDDDTDDKSPTEYNGTGNADVDSPTIKLTEATDTGLKDGYTTNDQNPAFEGSAIPGSSVEIYLDNTLVETVTADGDGHFTSEANYNLNGGDYLLHAVNVFSGGERFQSTVHALTIDIVAPDLPSLELSASSNTSTVLDGNLYTSDTTPSLHGLGGDPNSTVTLEVSFNGGAYKELSTIDVGSDGSWSYTLTSDQALGDGDYTFRLSSTDDAGNKALGVTFLNDVVVKTDTPTSLLSLSAASDSMDEDAGGTPGDQLTNADSIVLVADASADTAAVEILRVGSGAYISLGQATKVGGDWVFTVEHADIPTDGTYKFVARATDVAGNVEIIQGKFGLEVEIDRTPEEVAPHFDDLDASSDTSDAAGLLGTDDDGYTNAGTISLNGSAGVGKPVDIYLSVDGGDRILISDGEITTDGMGDWTYSYDVSAYGTDGTQNLVFTAEVLDPAANVTSTTLAVDVDHTDPDRPTIGLADALGTVESDVSEVVATVRNTTATLEGVVTESGADVIVTVYAVDGSGNRTAIADNVPGGAAGSVTMADNGNGTYTWSYDYGAVNDGQSYTFEVNVEDKAGNVSEYSKTLTIHADRTINAPAIDLNPAQDTTGGPDGTAGDDYTTYENDNPANAFELQVSGDDNSTISVYLLDASAPGAQAIVVNGVTVGTGVLVESVHQDVNDNWPSVSFDASSYAGTTTDLDFVAVTEDKAGNQAYTDYSFTLDDVDPTGGPIDLAQDDDFGTYNYDNITNAKEILLTGTLTEGADAVKVTVYDNGVELGEATVSGGGWTYTIGNEGSADPADYIGEGGHSYTAVIEDNAGNQTTLSNLDVTIDRSISDPTFELTSGVGSSDTGRITDDGVTNADSLVFNGTCDADDVVSVHMVFNNTDTVIDTFEAGTASWTRPVDHSYITEDGDYSFYITTTDTAGNTNTSQASAVDVTIDRTTDAPDAPELDSSSDTYYQDGAFTAGTSDSDGVTYATTLTITGNVGADGVEAYSVVNLYVDGVNDVNGHPKVVGTTTAGADGTWSIDFDPQDLADAPHDFYVRYVDLAGNESGDSGDLHVTLDREVPNEPAIAMADGTDFHIHDGDYYTNDVNPTFTISGLEDGTWLNIKVDGVSVATPQVSGTSYDFVPADFPTTDVDGTEHTITVVAVDSAGNASPPAEFSFTLDTKAAFVTGVQLTAASDSGESATDDYTNVTTPTIEGWAEANAAVTVVLKDADGNVVFTDNAVTADASGHWTSTVTDGNALSDGETYTVEVSATDYAGNPASDNSYSFELDTSIEAVGLHMVEDPANDTGESASDRHTGNLTPEFAWTAGEDLTATISLYNDSDVLLGTYTVDSPSGDNDWTVPFNLGDGDYTLKATFVDQAGNTVLTNGGVEVTESVDFTIDHSITKPTFELYTSGLKDSDTGRIGDDGVTNATDLVFHGTSDVGDMITVYRGAEEIGSFEAGSTSWDFTVSNAQEGTFNYYVTAEDQAGNSDASSTVAVTVDHTDYKPGDIDLADESDSYYADIRFSAISTDEDDTTGKTDLTFTGDVEAGGVEANSIVYLYVDGEANPVGQAPAGSLGSTWSITIDSSGLDDGSHNFYVKYVDLAGNESELSNPLPVDIDHHAPLAPTIEINGDDGDDYFFSDDTYYTNHPNPTFTLGNLEVGTYLDIRINDVPQDVVTVNSTSHLFDPADFNNDGSDDREYTITVVAVDTAGNASDPVSFSFILDTQSEGISGVRLTSGSDSGTQDDDITNITAPTITGFAEANVGVEVVVTGPDGLDHTTITTSDSNGKWEADISEIGQDGLYSVLVTSTDASGNTIDNEGNEYTFTVDTTINEVGFHMVEDPANDTGFTDDDQYTRNPNPSFEWTCHEDLTATISIYDENGDLLREYTVDSPDGQNGWTVPGGEPLGEGDYTVTATFTDAAGNVLSQDINGDPIESVSLTIDRTPPELTVRLTNDADSGDKGDWLINDEAITADLLHLTGDGEDGSRIYVYVNDLLHPVTDPHSGNPYLTVTGDTWDFDLSALDIGSGLIVGDNDIRVVAMDQAGNQTIFTETLEIDSEVIPVGQILLEDDSNTGSKSDFITFDTTPTLYGYTEGNATVVLSVEDEGGNVTVVTTVTADGSGYWSVDVPEGVLTTDGDYTFTADITDEAGNEATTSQVLTIDTDLAAPTITMDVDSFGSFNGTDSDFITDDTTPVFTITAELDTKLEIFRDGVLVHTVENVDGVLPFTESELAEGTYTYLFKSTDDAGNTSSTTQEVKIDPTYEAADLTVALDSEYDTGVSDADGLTNEPRPVFSGTAEAGSKVRVYFSDRYDTRGEAQDSAVGADYKTELTLADGVTTWDYAPSALANDGSADGFYKVTVVSQDEAGNEQTTTTIMELDTTPPEPTPTFELTALGDNNTIISETQTTDNTPGFAGTAEAGSTVSITVKAYGSANAALVAKTTADENGNWFYQVENADSLADGSYNVSITNTDDAGNVAEGLAEFQITGDTPAAPTIGLDSAYDTNIDTDGVTSQNTNLTLTGIAQSYANVTLYVTNAGDTECTGGTPVTTVEAGGNGVWKADLSGTLADDTYYYYVSSEYSPDDVFKSGLYTMVVDSETITPTLELLDDTGVADEWLDPAPNTSDSDWESSNATITGTVDEGATVVITATNTSTHAVTTVTIDPENLTKINDEWTYNHDLSGLGDGEFDIQVTTTDLAGNTASSAVQTMHFDSQTVKPTIDLPTLLDTEVSVNGDGHILLESGDLAGPATLEHLLATGYVSNNTDGYTQENRFVLTGTGEPGALIRIIIEKDDDDFPSPNVIEVLPDGTWTYDTGDLEDGMYTFNVTSTDIAGNEGIADTLKVYVDAEDTRGPAIVLNDSIPGNDTPDPTPNFTLYGDSDSTWLLYLDNEAEPFATGTFDVESRAFITPGETAGIDLLAPNVEHTFTLVTVDRAGNVAVTNPFNFEIDTIAPLQQANPVEVTGTSNIDPADGSDPMKIYTNDNDPTITIKVEAGTQARIVGFGNGQWLADTDGNGEITFTVPGSSIVSDGSLPVTVEFRDAAHNHDSSQDLEFNLVVDTSRPATTIELDSAYDLGFSDSDGITSGDQLVLSGDIFELGLGQDAGDFTTNINDYSVTVTNTDTHLSQVIDSDHITFSGDGTWTLIYGEDGTPLDSGHYEATLTASDMAGNEHSSTTEFDVVNETLETPEPTLMGLGGTGYYLLSQSDYQFPDGTDHTDYKYEMTFYGKDQFGNDISQSMGEQSFNSSGGIEEVINPTLHNKYDYVGIKVIDHAGNESSASFTDVDTTDVDFSAEVNSSADVASLILSITGDTDGDGIDDFSLTTDPGGVNVLGNGNWTWNFAGTLAEGDYTLHFEGFDGANSSGNSVGGEFTYDFTVLADEMNLASDSQDFSAGEADMGDSGDPGSGGGSGGDTVEIDATVHVDYVEGSVS